MKLSAFTTFICFLISAPYVEACTTFCVSSGDVTFFGNNEDWRNPETRYWVVNGKRGEFGRIYFGFDNLFPQGGMNQAGLCFDGLATEFMPVTGSSAKPRVDLKDFIDRVMARCSSVDEVIKEFRRVNVSFLEHSMMIYSDASGASVIIEGDEIIRKEGTFQIATNFYQSKTEIESISCERYLKARSLLSTLEGVPTAEFCSTILETTKQSGEIRTVYSTIYDLKNRKIWLYSMGDFSDAEVLDLSRELELGDHVVRLRDIFMEDQR